MKVAVLLLLALLYRDSGDPGRHFQRISLKFHKICLSLSPAKSESQEKKWVDVQTSFICGAPLSSTKFTEDLKTLGLIHILVVSGSHLIFLMNLLRLLQETRFGGLVWAMLGVYTLASGLNPPIARAFIFLSLSHLNRILKIEGSPWILHLQSLLFCLLIFPVWWGSVSFFLSIGAALSLEVANQTTKNPVLQCVYFYILFFPFIVPIQSPHPMTILTNFFLLPFVSTVLFPASLISYFIHPLTPLSDFFWSLLKHIAEISAPYLRTETPSTIMPQFFLIYPVTIVLVLNLSKLRNRRV